MPHLHVLSGSGASLRRLLADETAKLASAGYTGVRRQEGGDWGALLCENRGRDLFDELSVVVVEDGETLGTMPGRLAPMLEGSGASTHILLVCKTDGPRPVAREHEALCTISKVEAPPPWSKERDGIILSEARKHGVGATRNAVFLLKELFDDISELASEAEKVARVCVLRRRSEVSVSDVEDFCMSDGNRNLLKLLDGLCSGNRAESLASFEDMSARSELTPLLSALHNRFRMAMYFALFPGERSLYARALGAKDYAARMAGEAAAMYGSAKLLDFVTGLIRIAANERTGRGASWKDLGVLVIDLLAAPGSGTGRAVGERAI
jgi:DNA polymerase-3 subunit delta